MYFSKSISVQHADTIHDISYNFYSNRMVTCSSDQSINVYDLKEDGQWHATASWRTHSGSVWKVKWAHPEFGQVIASCSLDRTVALWEEVPGSGGDPSNQNSSTTTSWVKRCTLVDSRASITDVKFAPRWLGLHVSTCGTDGIVRVYEAQDVMNLAQLTLQQEITTGMAATSLSWSQSRLDPPLLAVGGTSPENIAGGPSTATSYTDRIQIYECIANGTRWEKLNIQFKSSDVPPFVNDIAFAPNPGKSFHTLAVASNVVYLWNLRIARRKSSVAGVGMFDFLNTTSHFVTSSNTTVSDETTQIPGNMTTNVTSSKPHCSSYEVSQVTKLSHHNHDIWRLAFNCTGTVLASTGDDGCVHLWQINYAQVWTRIALIKPDTSHHAGDDHLPLIISDPAGLALAASIPTNAVNSNLHANMEPASFMPAQDVLTSGITALTSGVVASPVTPFHRAGNILSRNQAVWH